MVKSLEFIRPAGIPYSLLNFQFYFENENSRWINILHSAGMQLVYYKARTCYTFPQNEFYELLLLQNTEQLHETKYNWLVMKGVFEGVPSIKLRWAIENGKQFSRMHPENRLDREQFYFHRMPEPDNDIIISEGTSDPVFYHFFCSEVYIDPNKESEINLYYLNTYSSVDQILDRWFDENGQPASRDH